MLKQELDRLLLENVVTLLYTKQNGQRRQMVCTKSAELLQSFEGEAFLGYRQPKSMPNYDIDATNNIIVFDIMVKDFRNIAADRAVVKGSIPGGKYREILIKQHTR